VNAAAWKHAQAEEATVAMIKAHLNMWMWGMEIDREDNPVPSEDPETFIK